MIRVVLVVAVAAAIVGTASSADNSGSHDWPLYGYDTARHNASPSEETQDTSLAYARFPPSREIAYPGGLLPGD